MVARGRRDAFRTPFGQLNSDLRSTKQPEDLHLRKHASPITRKGGAPLSLPATKSTCVGTAERKGITCYNALCSGNNTKLKLPSPIDGSKLAHFLQGFDPVQIKLLINGFRLGFRIPSLIPPQTLSNYTNHKTTASNPIEVSSKLSKELKLGRIAGPFTAPPLHSFICSPLGLIPKKNPGEFRLIHDLSFPHGASVNDFIDPAFTQVHYEDLDHCIDLLQQLGPSALIAKADLKDAFRILPVHPDDHRLLGFQWDGAFYYDKCLPMGCSVSCQLFEAFSTAIQWILTQKLGVQRMSHILDDFIFFGPPKSPVCKRSLDTFLTLASALDLPIKESKTVLPSTKVTLHGIEVCTGSMSLHLPQAKLEEMRDKVLSMKRRKKTRLVELQSLLGSLNFACRAVVPGRAFLRRLQDLTINVTRKCHQIRLTKEARADLAAWEIFLSSFNGRVLCLPKEWSTSEVLKLYTDASGFAYGGFLGPHWFQGHFPTSWKDKNIAIKELLPIALATRLWGEELSNKKIIFFCDNTAVVAVINKMSTKDSELMSILRSLIVTTLQFNFLFVAKHISGKCNAIADCLSRWQVNQAREKAPWLDAEPQQIPRPWLPW